MRTFNMIGNFADWRARLALAPEGVDGGDGGDNGGGADGAPDAGAGNGGEPPAGDGVDNAGDATRENGGDPSSWQYDFGFYSELGLGDDAIKQYEDTYRELGLNPEAVGRLTALEQSLHETQAADDEAYLGELEQQLEADKYLSENWDVTSERVAAALKAAGAPAEQLEGLQDNPTAQAFLSQPWVMKAFAMLGQAMSDDKFDAGAAANEPVDAARSWYGETTPQTKRS